ncbi:baseplate J/gp47 family protein [Pseudomonas monsensis]|uniref:baseplate J/gp47 family protein n=1 Tax=Pseudomonas TaxID=286 RepID=UPI003D2098C0
MRGRAAISLSPTSWPAAYIDGQGRRPVTAEVFVAAPIADPLNMAVKLSPNTAAVQAAVRAEISDLIDRDSKPGSPILISRLREAVSVAAGESDNAITSPTADVAHATGHMAVPGTITFSSF